ncbi:hypothetical protein BJY04DRAFT_215854 [Aspergillus karnatakaensis]|uniref:uncharacterized protein n=1 Tax=Aspergillus karnatakaensis TaxID=1810916 RepID=UPI003CCD5A1F
MTLAFRAARLLASSFADLIHDGVVVIEGDRITHVGSWESLSKTAQPPELTIRDLGNVTLMPGLFDCHVHLQLDPTNHSGGTTIDLPDDALLTLMAKHAQRLLDAGITTARDLGSKGQSAIHIREMIARGEIPGPRLHCANAPLTVPGGHAHALGGECQGVEGVIAEVRKRKAEGADVVKVMATGGFVTANTHPSQARFSQEEMDAIAGEAHRLGLPVTTHATGTEGIRRAAEAGVDSVEHCAWIGEGGRAEFDERVARRMLENGVAVCPTMNTACVEHDYFCPWDAREVIVTNLTRLRESGVTLLVGTDAGIPLCPFERYADGITVLGDAGYSPREIIAGATENAAAACRLAGVTGKLEVGLAADVVAFEGNPLEDLTAFGKPCFVMALGREHALSPIASVDDQSELKATIRERLQQGGK